METRCGDRCPELATTIVAYEVPVSDCESTGGIVEWISVTMAITSTAIRVCVPKALVRGK